jgi:hypothetical protein
MIGLAKSLTPQDKVVLQYLKENRAEGLTQLEASRWARPILRLSERVRELESFGHHIEHVPERHEGGNHTRYFLGKGE